MARTLTSAQARRIVLAAQGFTDRRPAGRIDVRHLRRVMDRVNVLQLDSVNVLVRSHYLPVFARLGPYPRELLDAFAYRRRELFEYWGHAASLMPVRHFPLFRHRMQDGRPWRGVERLAREEPGYLEAVLDEVRERGPLGPGDLSEPGTSSGSWWGWGKGKTALEWHFWRGAVTTHDRPAFTRIYDVTERVIPAEHRAAPAPSRDEARRELLMLAARSFGIGTARDLADYYRLPIKDARPHLDALADEGALERVEVRGWKEPAFLHPEASAPRRIRARALLSPFDSLIWAAQTARRERVERLFGFSYELELYTPPPKRVYGYYVLPFLLDDALVARVDLKSDRPNRTLLVRGAFVEPAADHARVARELAAELRLLATWLGLDDIAVADHGDLAPVLRTALR